MSRIVWNDEVARGGATLPIEVHYGSPNEFLGEFSSDGARDSVFLETKRLFEPGAQREVFVHVGFIGRTIRLHGRVETVITLSEAHRTGRAPGVWVSLVGADGRPCAELRKIVQQIQQGLAYEAARVTGSSAGERLSREKQIRAMPTTLKIMLALKADREDRAALASDPDPQVLQFLLKNSKIGIAEIRTLSARPSLSHQHIVTIAANAGWIADDQVKLNLARNPRLPETLVEGLLSSLSVSQLKVVASSVSTSGRARRVAHRILYSRGA